MKVQFIRTAGGEDLAVLPRAEYDRLCDLAQDQAEAGSANRILARIRAGEEEIVPGEVANQLLGGENPIRVWRRYRGFTQARLAEAAGLGKAYLSQLETGVRRGPAATLAVLAQALRVDIDDLVSAAGKERRNSKVP